jgi:hypothetical protein
MTTTTTTPAQNIRVPVSTVRLARALVRDAKRRGTREDPRIEAVAHARLPEDKKR